MAAESPNLNRSLRDQAEAIFASRPPLPVADLSSLAQEAQIRQIELEIENEQLRQRLDEHQEKSFLGDTMDALGTHVCVLGPGGKIMATNQAWRAFAERSVALSRADFGSIGADYLAICNGETGPYGEASQMMAVGIRSVMDGDCEDFELEYMFDGDDAHHWFLARVARFYKQAGCVIIFHEEITDRKRIEEKLLESMGRLNNIVGSAMDAIITINADQRIIFFNRAAEKMLRCPAQLAIGERIERFIPARFRGTHHRDVEQFGRNKTTNRAMGHLIPLSALRADGEEFPIEASISLGNASGNKEYTVIMRDITERKSAETKLRSSELKFTRAFNDAPLMMTITDLETGIILEANARFLQVAGFAYNEVIGHTMVDLGLLTLQERNKLRELLSPAGLIRDQEISILSKDKKRIHLLYNGVILNDGPHTRLLSLSLDMNERKTAIEALRESEERQRLLIQNLHVGILVQGPQAEIRACNPFALELLGLTEEQLLGRSSFDPRWNVIHEDGTIFPGQEQPAPQAIAQKRPIHGVAMGVYRPIHQDRIWLSVDAEPEIAPDGKLVQVICTFTDITERKKIEETERKQRLLAEALRDIAATLNSSLKLDHISIKLILQLVVDKSLEILPDAEHAVIHTLDQDGYLRSQAIARQTHITPNQDWMMRAGEGVAGLALQSREIIIIPDTAKEPRYVHRQGAMKFHSMIVCPLIVHGDAIGTLSVQATKTDVFTEKHREIISLFSQQAVIALENLRHIEMQAEKREQALELQKLAEEALEKERAYNESQLARASAEAANQAKSIFLANMSHELRTPLNGISGYIQLLERDPSLSDKQRGQVSIIARCSDHLLNLINGILTLSKVEAGEIELASKNVHLSGLLQELDDLFWAKAQEKKIGWQQYLAPNTPLYLQCDETKLRQILINLIGNAFKFTGYGHVFLHVNLEFDEEAGQTVLLFQVKDTGVGMPKERQAQLFSSLTISESISKVEGGAGLGLVISRQYARMMGGDISFVSKENEGTTFSLRVPYIPASGSHDLAESPTQSLAISHDKIKALVVDDDEASLNLLHNILLEIGFNLRLARNGQQALSIALAWQPQFIFMDLRMPEMDGLTAMKQIRVNTQNYSPFIVAVTANIFESEAGQMTRAGFTDLIHKPYKFEHVYKIIQKYIRLQPSPDKTLQPQPITTLPAGSISKEDASELQHLIRSGHTRQAIERCQTIQNKQPETGALLSRLLAEYRFDQLLEILQDQLN